MKIFKMTLIIIIISTFFSCDEEVGKAYLLDNDTLTGDTIEINFIQNKLKSISYLMKNDTSTYNKNVNFIDKSTIDFIGKNVIVADEVKKLFDPEECPCSLPEKVKNRLKRLKEDGKSWAPPYVVEHLKDFSKVGIHLSGESVTSLMHSIKIKSENGQIRDWIVFQSPTFNNFDFNQFLVIKGFNSFIYSLDCSGYLNAAIEASAKVPGNDIKTKAKLALKNQSAMFVGGGVLISPLNTAFYGGVFGIEMDTIERINILNALISIPNLTDTDSIIISNSFEVIWASSDGSSGFNGEATFNTSGKGGIGVAKITAGASTGTNLTRQSTFSRYDTYFTKSRRIPNFMPYTVFDVKELLNSLRSN